MDHRYQSFPTGHTTIMVSKAEIISAESLMGVLTKFVGSNRLSRFVVGGFLSRFTAAHLQSLPLWFPFQHVAKRSRPFTDEASKYTGLSSKSKPEGKSVLELASVRHQKSSPLIPAQEKMQSDIQGQENPCQALRDRLHFPGPTRNPEVTEPGASDSEDCMIGSQNENSRMQRHLDATSPIIPMQASGGGLHSFKKEDEKVINLLSPGVKLISNLVTRVEDNLRKTFVK